MAKYRITDPGGQTYEIEAPDDATEEQVFQMVAARSNLPQGTPQVKGPDIVQGEPDDKFVGFLKGAARPLDAAADLAEGAYNQTLGRVFGESTSADTPAFQNAAEQLERFNAGQTGAVGDPSAETLGEIGGTAVLTRGLGGPGMQGAAGGVLMSDAEDAWGTAKDAVAGFVGGKIAQPIIKGVGNLISPVIDESAAMLHSLGTRLTPGQAIPALKRLEDRMSSWPFVGEVIQQGRKASFNSFNRAVMNDILKPIGEALPATIKTGQRAIKYVGDQLSDRYERLIPNLTLKPDPQLVTEMTDIGKRLTTGELAPTTVRKFEAMIRDGVVSRMKGKVATGEEYRAADRYLSNKIARYAASTSPEDQAMAEALRDVQGSLSSALARSNPNAAAELESLNAGWSLLVPAETAAGAAKRGIFSADQYRTAVRQSNKTVRKRGMARGEARGQALAEAASEILPSEYPDSGTSGREALNMTDPRFWGGLALRQVYNPTTQNALSTIALSPRPGFTQPIAEGIKALPAPQIGASVSLNALSPFYAVPPSR